MRLPTSLLIKILGVAALLAECCCIYFTFSIDLINGNGWFQYYPGDVNYLQTPRTQPTTRSRSRQQIEEKIGLIDSVGSVETATGHHATTTNGGTNTTITSTKRQYLAFDKAAPRAVLARSHGSSALPNAVPLRRTVPRAYADNEMYHVHKKMNTTTNSIRGERGGPKRPWYNGKPDWGSFHHGHDYLHDNRALYLQNPVVLALRNTLPDAPHDPDDLSPDDLWALTGGDPTVRYLALYSANTGGKCFGPEHTKLYKTGEALSYYAVALLDAKLDVIPGTDVLIDINNVSPHWPHKPHYFQQQIGDCRVNLMEGWMYWVCCKHLFRVKIKRRAEKKEEEEHRPEKNNAELTFPYTFPNIYGDGLEITLFSGQLIAHGKNFNFFRAPSTTYDNAFDHYLQLFPVPHVHHKLRIPPFDDKQLGNIELVASGEHKQTAPLPPPAFGGPNTPHTIVTCPENEDGKHKEWVTNCTTPDVNPFFHMKDHGTACCITLSLGEEQRDVLVGISHVKTTRITNPWWRRDVRGKYNHEDVIPMSRYLSRFVAYDVNPPFHVAALSGWFCLGFGEEEEDVVGGGNVLMTGKNREVRLVLFDGAYDCPAIHFPSGIAEVVGDPTQAIIAYGINDCTQRMIVVEKEDVARRLLQGV